MTHSAARLIAEWSGGFRRTRLIVLRWRPVAAERWLTVKEVADRFGVCTATVYAMCKRGELRHVRVGNSIRFADVELPRAGRRR
jgi:excisionase family DNA binding protein